MNRYESDGVSTTVEFAYSDHFGTEHFDHSNQLITVDGELITNWNFLFYSTLLLQDTAHPATKFFCNFISFTISRINHI